jgi:putative membrane protein insertion efficiency factor
MVFAPVCAPVPVGRSSSPAASRAAAGSRLDLEDQRAPGVPGPGTQRPPSEDSDFVVQLRQRSVGLAVARRVLGGALRRQGDDTQPVAPTSPCDRGHRGTAPHRRSRLVAHRGPASGNRTYVREVDHRGVVAAIERGETGDRHGVEAGIVDRPPSRRDGRLLLRLIDWYQRSFEGRPSPCRFTPSCSSYAREALELHGSRRGLWLMIRRLTRCRPFGPSGFDPVPPAGSGHTDRARIPGDKTRHVKTRCATTRHEGSTTQ